MKSLSHFNRRLEALNALSKDLWIGVRLAFKLPFFLRHPVTLEETKSTVKDRLERREEAFLAIIRKAIYPYPDNPYWKLLNLTGCEYGDLEMLVNKEGVEGALRVLFCDGVYLTVDEFKGRRPVVRCSFKMEVHPDLFRNPFSTSHLLAQSSGSRGARTNVSVDLAKVRDEAIHRQFVLQARGAGKIFTGLWMGPGGPDIKILLAFCFMGYPLVRWFVRGGDPAQQSISWRWRTKLMRYGSLLGGARIPEPTYVPHDDSLPIAHWMAEVLHAGNTPLL